MPYSISADEWEAGMTDDRRLQLVADEYGDIAHAIYEFLYDFPNAYSLHEVHNSALERAEIRGEEEINAEDIPTFEVSTTLDELEDAGLVDSKQVATTEGDTWYYRAVKPVNLQQAFNDA